MAHHEIDRSTAPEPFPNEISRMRREELIDNDEAIQFAFNVDSLYGNEPNYELEATLYNPIQVEEIRHNGEIFYRRYSTHPELPNLGLIETDFIRSKIKYDEQGNPIIWQIGPKRRKLALAQRVEYFKENQNQTIHSLLDSLEQKTPPSRSLKRHPAIDEALGVKVDNRGNIIYTRIEALESIGYVKKSSDKKVSRQPQNNEELFHKIGKYYRRVIGLGSMPPTTGSADVLATTALGHMVSFIPRNSRYAGNIELQIELYERAIQKVDVLNIPDIWKDRAKHNIGVSLGTDNPDEILKEAQQFYNRGVRLFRIYTINSDPRVVETARKLREQFGHEIEIFVGQIPDKKLALQLIAPDIDADLIILGHGGGGQCDSAGNGMGVKTTEEVDQFMTDEQFKNTCFGIEGSVGRNIGPWLIRGVDLILYNKRVVNSGIEDPSGELYFEHIKSTPENPILVQSNPGSASSETMTIEAVNPLLTSKRISSSGRTKSPEGVSGFKYFKKRAAGSIVFWIKSLYYDTAKVLADRGVSSISELRQQELENEESPLRLISERSQYVGSPHNGT